MKTYNLIKRKIKKKSKAQLPIRQTLKDELIFFYFKKRIKKKPTQVSMRHSHLSHEIKITSHMKKENTRN
jgi:hypothetical protein